MAKRKTAASASKQTNGAKKPTKPRIKKPAKLPKPFTQEELTASYSSIPAADLEPIDDTTPNNQEPATDDAGPQKQPASVRQVQAQSKAVARELGEITNATRQPEPSDQTQFPSSALRTLEEGETDRERTEGNSTKDTASNTLKAGTQAEDSETRSHVTPLSGTDTNQGITGDVSLSVAETVAVYAETQQNPVIPSRARMSGESRPSYWESMRKTARAAGLPRGQGPGTAYEWATVQAEREYAAEIAPLLPEPTEPEPIAESVAIEFPPEDPEPENSPIGENLEVAPAPIASDQGVPGLGTMPESWGTLPANASLQVEISWVSANRLRVRDGSGVDLSKALSPAPSYSALSWLETSILFPSKFADISVKATANQDDEREAVRREKLSIEEIRGLLAEMLEE